ncbi:MAG TPA: serine hydrolase domain-containing protein [Verrucomicrobiae bacterium]|nr:serine hydrolase domain-containing protein [Verrucomicrobiae bacterium]
MHLIILCLVLWATGLAALAESTDRSPDLADRLFTEWNKTNAPGCLVAVSRNGEVIYERGFGMANLELGVPITPATILPVASISKQFTALSILLLAQRGQLSLDDEVWKYVPEWADRKHRITIRHLLSHTSGLREAFTLIGLAAPREDGVSVNDAIVKMLARQQGLNFLPGTDFQYNNGGYNLLGSIVKRVSGQSLREFADANIFRPLGMLHTHFHDDPSMLVPNRATGYSPTEGGFKLARPEGGIVGNAGLFTTARDLMLWEQNFAEARVGTPALLAEMQRPAIATDWGDESFYGFGLSIGKYRGLRVIGHGGGDPGVAAYVARYPDQAFAVAVIGNRDDLNAMGLTRSIADIYLANSFPASASATNATSSPVIPALTAEQLASKAGLYRDTTTEVVGRFFVRDGKLMASEGIEEANAVALEPLDTNRFSIPGTTVVVEFVPATKNQPQIVRVTGVGPKTRISRQIAPFSMSKDQLQAFAGSYVSSEIETTYTVVARETDLMVTISGRGDTILKPVFKDAFAGLGIVKFSRNARGSVTGFTLNRHDLRGLRFERTGR